MAELRRELNGRPRVRMRPHRQRAGRGATRSRPVQPRGRSGRRVHRRGVPDRGRADRPPLPVRAHHSWRSVGWTALRSRRVGIGGDLGCDLRRTARSAGIDHRVQRWRGCVDPRSCPLLHHQRRQPGMGARPAYPDHPHPLQRVRRGRRCADRRRQHHRPSPQRRPVRRRRRRQHGGVRSRSARCRCRGGAVPSGLWPRIVRTHRSRVQPCRRPHVREFATRGRRRERRDVGDPWTIPLRQRGRCPCARRPGRRGRHGRWIRRDRHVAACGRSPRPRRSRHRVVLGGARLDHAMARLGVRSLPLRRPRGRARLAPLPGVRRRPRQPHLGGLRVCDRQRGRGRQPGAEPAFRRERNGGRHEPCEGHVECGPGPAQPRWSGRCVVLGGA